MQLEISNRRRLGNSKICENETPLSNNQGGTPKEKSSQQKLENTSKQVKMKTKCSKTYTMQRKAMLKGTFKAVNTYIKKDLEPTN